MGQKTHPHGFRLGVNRSWASKWYEDKNYAKWLHEDQKLRKAIKKKFAHAGIAAIDIERAANKAKIVIHTSRPGIIIGKRGAGVEQLKEELQKLTENELFIDIQEIRKAETNAQLVAENIATQLERRVAFRRAMKKALQTAMKFGAKGVRVRTLGPPGRRRDRAHREVPRGARAAAHPARRHRAGRGRRPSPPTARSASSAGSSRARSSRSAAASGKPARRRADRACALESRRFRHAFSRNAPSSASRRRARTAGLSYRAADVSTSATSACRRSSRGSHHRRARSRRRVWRSSAPPSARASSSSASSPTSRSPRSRSRPAWVTARAAWRSGWRW